MILANGTKLLICHRRLFADDNPRYFFGEVEVYADGVAKVTGYTWARDQVSGFQRKADRRTKLIAVASGSMIIYELPKDVELEEVRVEQPSVHSVVATDGKSFTMDLAERI